METETVETLLTRIVSCLDENRSEALSLLQSCEQELVTNRFAKAVARDGRAIRVRVPAVDAALIDVSRALSLLRSSAGVDEIRQTVEHAMFELSPVGVR